MSGVTSSAKAGAYAAVPLAIAAFPFGLVYGAAVKDSTVDSATGAAASWLVLAGASQLSMLDLIDNGASWVVVVGTALVINARMALYSAALAKPFSEFGLPSRLFATYLMTDQAASLAMLEFDKSADVAHRRRYYLAAATLFASSWWGGTLIGVLAGGAIPDGAQIGFSVPLMFLALLVPTLSRRPAIVAAVVATLVTVATTGLPEGFNILLGALAGIAAGRSVDR